MNGFWLLLLVYQLKDSTIQQFNNKLQQITTNYYCITIALLLYKPNQLKTFVTSSAASWSFMAE